MTETTKEPVYASKAKPWLKYYEDKYIHQTVPECSAFALICRNNEQHLGDTALEYYGRKFSYADLIVQVKKTAAALQALGVKKGDIITVVSVMTPEVVYAFYAADLLGATLNLVDPRYSAEGIREYIQEVESRLLICLNVTYERCHKAERGVPPLPSGRKAHQCGAGGGAQPRRQPAAGQSRGLQADKPG